MTKINRARRSAARVAVIGGAVALALSFEAASAAPAPPLISEFSAGLQASNHSLPYDVAAGPDGNVWFTDQASGAPAIGRITPTGTITEFMTGLTAHSVPRGIVAGPDGNMWFTDPGSPAGSGAIGRITPSGHIDEFSAGLQTGSVPAEIAVGPDGNLWFTDQPSGAKGGMPLPAIGQITPDGTITEFFNGLNNNSMMRSFLNDIAAGPGGTLWFTDTGANSRAVGRIIPSTNNALPDIVEFPVPGSAPEGIAAGPDGNMWFADGGSTTGAPEIGQITPSGAVTQFSAGLQANNGSDPIDIAQGADGNMWFTDAGATSEVGQITPAGTISEFASGLQAGNASLLNQIAPGPGGELWFGDQGGTRAIGRLDFPLPPAATTGTASAITATTASVAGTVNPRGSAVSASSVQYGPTTAYGSTVPTSPATLANGEVPVAVSAALSGLPPGTAIHYRVVATNAFGTTAGPDQTFSTLAANRPAPNRPEGLVPHVAGASESNRVWREGNRRATFASKKAPVGTTFSFTLNEPASVSLAFTQRVSGRKVNGRCVARTRKNAKKRTCKRTVTQGTISFTGHTGLNKVSFQGRISTSRKLPSGRYTLVITANVSGRSAHPVTLSFTIVKK